MAAKQGQNQRGVESRSGTDPGNERISVASVVPGLLLFTFGINLSLWISDIVSLRVMDVRNTEHFRIKERKTGKIRKIRMTGALKQEIEKYTRQMSNFDLLFPYRKVNFQSVVKRCGGPLTGLHERVGLKARLAPIRCAKPLAIRALGYPSVYWH